MVEHGCKLSIEEIGKGMIDYVAQKEFERIPWIDGVEDVLLSLKEAGVPSMLVTTSPRHLAENLIAQAPAARSPVTCAAMTMSRRSRRPHRILRRAASLASRPKT